MKNTEKNIFPFINEMIEDGVKDLSSGLQKEFKFSRRQALRWLSRYNNFNNSKLFQKIDDLRNPVKRKEIIESAQKLRDGEIKNLKDIELSTRYFYNKEDDKYIFFCKKAGKNIVLEGSFVKRIISCYSNLNGDESSISELSLKFNIPKIIIQDILNCLNFTHSDPPILPEELLNKTEEDLLEDLIQDKKFSVYQKYQKREWQETLDKAKKWDEFRFGTLKPLEDFLTLWKPPVYKPYKLNTNKSGNSSLVVCINDIHYGNTSDNSLFWGKKQSTEYTVNSIKKYYQDIINDIKKYNYQLDEIVLTFLGDILHSSNPFGTTTKGSQLKSDLLSEEMFEVAFNSLVEFIRELSKVAPKTKVYSVKGNHWGVGDNILLKALGIYFKEQKNIQFNVFNSHTGLFRIQDALIAITHGAMDSYKAKLPKGVRLEATVQSILMKNTELLNQTKQRILLAADLHHGESKEFNSFEYILCPSMVRDDNYADALNLNSRPCQKCLLIDKSGIKQMINYYFD